MIAILIFGISALTVLQFFVSYCHCLIVESRGCELSEQGQELSRVTGHTGCDDQFRRLAQLIALCPEPGGEKSNVRAMSLYFYFAFLGMIGVLFGWLAPAVAGWLESERGDCTYVVAVILDRRIAYNRVLTARQMSSPL